jgi:SAM-dependent MidA family methyltransferase
MEAALYDPQFGYYNRSDLNRWGRSGDYRTSPELSDLFAATFASFFAAIYQQLGAPSRWTIVESGAGNGQFAAVVLDRFKRFHPSVYEATHYIIDDVSEDSRRLSRERLATVAEKVEYCELDQLAEINPGIFFSNELVDAFPVHLLTLEDGAVRELYVELEGDGHFKFSARPVSASKLTQFLERQSVDLKEGQVVEVNLHISDWLSSIAEKLTAGYVITVDYGAEQDELYGLPERFKGTLRAFRQHQFVDDVLAEPGQYDITASVNWTQVRTIGERLGLSCISLDRLDQFLLREGLLEELQRRLDASTSEAEKLEITTRAREMILPGGMASHFQVMVQRRV